MGERGARVRTEDSVLLAVLILGVGADETPKVVILDFLLVAVLFVSFSPPSTGAVKKTSTVRQGAKGSNPRRCWYDTGSLQGHKIALVGHTRAGTSALHLQGRVPDSMLHPKQTRG
jgi:hypothetical protein